MLEKIKLTYEVSENQNNLFTQYHTRYNCKIKYNGKQYTFEYQCNPSADRIPNLNDCIDSLLLDMFSFEEALGIMDFMVNFGYSDYDYAMSIYKACEKTAKAMHRVFTDEEIQMIYDELNEM